MHVPTVLDAAFLLYLLVVLPVSAIRSAPLLQVPPADGGGPASSLTRMQAMASTLTMLLFTLAFAWITAAARDYDVFAGHRIGIGGVAAAAAALGLAIAGRAVVLQTMDETALRVAAAWMPRTGRERALGAATVVAAGVAEEMAFRGVAVVILLDTLGVVWPAILFSAAAFALAHFAQQWKGVLAVFVFALVMQGLVWWTGGLIAAMIVHAVYDIIAGMLGMRLQRRFAAS